MTGRMMMDRERTADYLLSLETDADALLSELRTYALLHGVPIVREETESFLRTMTALKRPRRILEIGTAIGYSTIVLARAQEASGQEIDIFTVESWERRIPIARENLARAGLSDRVRLFHQDAGALLKTLLLQKESSGGFDLVFLDAAKGQYPVWLPDIAALMNENAVLIADNVLQDGTVLEPRVTVERRDRTTHSRMREFLYEIKHHPALVSAVLPLGDGVSVSVKTAVPDGFDGKELHGGMDGFAKEAAQRGNGGAQTEERKEEADETEET